MFLWVEDANAQPLHFNRSWKAYTGQDAQTLEPESLLSLVHPDDLPELLRLRKASLQDKTPFELVLRLRRADGTYRRQLLRMRAVEGERSSDGDWSAACFDIEEMHRSIEVLQFLSEAGEELAILLDLEATLNRITELATRNMADWCVIHILQNGRLEPMAMGYSDPQQRAYGAEVIARHEQKPESWMSTVVRSGKTIYLPVYTPEHLKKGAADEADFQRLLKMDVTSVILTPLRTRGQALGILQLSMQHGRHTYTPEDVRAAEELARRAALAIENSTRGSSRRQGSCAF